MSTRSLADEHTPVRAHRLRRPSWRDPRLILGVLIILVSVAGVLMLLSAQDRTVGVYAAERSLSTGDHLVAEDLRTVQVQLPEAAGKYVSADEEIPEGLQLTRRVGEGEILPAEALAEAGSHGQQAITVQAPHDLARAVQPGRLVDVWAAAAPAAEDSAEAIQLVAAAEVTDMWESGSAFSVQDSVTVELLVSSDELEGLLSALGEGAALSVLPAASEEESS